VPLLPQSCIFSLRSKLIYHFPPALDTRVNRFLYLRVLFRLQYQPRVATDQPHLFERKTCSEM
jgi:hypothetical protein